MKLLQTLSTPWLLRRLIKSNERQAAALESIAIALNIKFGIALSPGLQAEDDDDDYAVSTDADTYERAQKRARSRGSDED